MGGLGPLPADRVTLDTRGVEARLLSAALSTLGLTLRYRWTTVSTERRPPPGAAPRPEGPRECVPRRRGSSVSLLCLPCSDRESKGDPVRRRRTFEKARTKDRIK